MDDTNNYSRAHPYSEEAKQMIDAFVQKTYRHTGRRLKYTHLWHGLMGYTPNGIRCVGAEPCNPILLYNLGCNGVGILPSVYGGFRISQIVNKEALPASIFDPADLRCLLPEQKSAQAIALPLLWLKRVVQWSLVALWASLSFSFLAAHWIQ